MKLLKKKKMALNGPTDAEIASYLVKIKELDQVIGSLTRGFCAECPAQPGIGCCDFREDPSLVPVQLLEVQRRECLQNGGDYTQITDTCRYHTPRGCSIPNSKTSICIGHMCDELEEYLSKTHGDAGRAFITAMHKVGSASMLRTMPTLLQDLDNAIAVGKTLID